MSVLDTVTPRQDQARTLPGSVASDQESISVDGGVSTLDAMAANWRLTLDRDEAGNFNNKVQAYNDLEDSLVAMGNPRSRYRDPRWGGWIQSVETSPERFKALWGGVVAARQRDPNAFADLPRTQEEFDVWAYGRKGAHARDMATSAQGGVGTAIIPGLAFGVSTAFSAENLPFLALGGGGKSLAEVIAGEALNGARMTAIQTPQAVRSAANMGENYTPGQMAQELALGAATNAAVGAGLRYGPGLVSAGVKAAADRVLPMDLKLARELERATGAPWERTPQQQAALNILNLHGEINASSPFVDTHAGLAAHQARVAGAIAALDGNSGVDGYLAAVRRSESGGNPNARNPMPGQSASGLYGFTNDTWLGAYRAEFPNSGLSREAILARKGDPALQERLMRRLTDDNAQRLRAMGVQADPANLYVMHHLGTGDGPRVLRAEPETPLSSLLSQRVIDANPYMRDMTVGDFLAWSRKKMGQEGGAIEGPVARAVDDGEAAVVEAERVRADAEAEVAAGMARDGAAPDDMMAPEAPRVDPGMIDRPDGDEVPQLRRDAFPDETSWRIAQSEVEAHELGLESPRVTRQTVWDDARTELAAAGEGTVYGALYHEDTGPIDVVWGDDTHGLAHIVGKHPDVVENLPSILDDMRVVPERSTRNRLHLESPDHVAKVRLDWDEQRQNWLLTAFKKDRKAPAAAEDGGATGVARDHSPTREAGSDIGKLRGARKADAVAPRASVDPQTLKAFDQPTGDGPTLVADSAWHDVRATLGDAMERYSVDLGDGKGARSVARIEEELKADAAAIEAIRSCL
ncbi:MULTISPECIES: hypothetical protein [Novosphingobium]|uniref:putative barnase/colicin E5 family endoribonuclease n=1 Tax=Novosphingobium TaxID=165696 RepID=UPI000D309173|nr:MULTISPECIES: hypothetical protein [Novosphingobium]PTR07863.1 hypothetical protein C8K11_11374 [Novosphingobium sp. GV055]PUB00676.1 hypothetical protein C8K12_11374 [Novosphingobium sp. GV061]PUB16085.1 hypothetical protein C8K14_11374 [Novosphingobium sp. GV079]PUB39550.1 hypothetical protein C8K10_11374 [Novosphingobium sp. GV027]WQD93780.1 hypothetical protein U0041_04055 [Novosphingobium capsulatum]